MGTWLRGNSSAASIVWPLLVLSACGGTTFSADSPGGDAADARSPVDAATETELDAGVDSSLDDRRAEVDRDAGLDAPLMDERGAADATIDGPRTADAANDLRPTDAASELRPTDAASEVRPVDAGSLYRGAVLADGPVAYWRMSITSGSVVPDESGRRNDLVLQGTGHGFGVPGAVVGDDDRAMRFDGSSSHAVAARPRDLDFAASAPFTIECWARRELTADGGAGDYFQQLVSASAGGPPNRNGYILYILPNDADPNVPRSSFEYDAPDMGQIAVDGPLPAASTYAYYVATFDGTKVSLYVDGTLVSTKVVNGSVAARTSEFVVGRESSTGRFHFAGAIDEVAVYDKALSTVRIVAHRDLALRR